MNEKDLYTRIGSHLRHNSGRLFVVHGEGAWALGTAGGAKWLDAREWTPLFQTFVESAATYLERRAPKLDAEARRLIASAASWLCTPDAPCPGCLERAVYRAGLGGRSIDEAVAEVAGRR